MLPEFLYFVFCHFKEDNNSQSIGAVFKNLTTHQVKDLAIPIPDIDVQRQIVAENEAEQALVNSNHKLIEIFEQKIQTKLAEVWGEKDQTELPKTKRKRK